MQQTIQGFFSQRKEDKHARSQQTVVSQVQAKRLASGKRLVLLGEGVRIHKERADQAKKEAEKAAVIVHPMDSHNATLTETLC